MALSLRLENTDGLSVDLYSWLRPELRTGFEALAGVEGFGLPPVTARWFQGAGEGDTWRSSRTERRPVRLPLWVYATSRSELNLRVSDLARVLDPRFGQATLILGTPDNEEWFLNVVRTGGGDWKRKEDSDDNTYFRTTIELEAGKPYWTRVRPEQFTVELDSSAPTLVPYLARLQLSSATAFGERTVTNPGDVPAWCDWTIKGPATDLLFVGADGETLHWTGSIASSDTVIVDTRNSQIYDQRGPVAGNLYSGLDSAPRFWQVAPGSSQVTVEIEGAQAGQTIAVCRWQPRRWAVV